MLRIVVSFFLFSFCSKAFSAPIYVPITIKDCGEFVLQVEVHPHGRNHILDILVPVGPGIYFGIQHPVRHGEMDTEGRESLTPVLQKLSLKLHLNTYESRPDSIFSKFLRMVISRNLADIRNIFNKIKEEAKKSPHSVDSESSEDIDDKKAEEAPSVLAAPSLPTEKTSRLKQKSRNKEEADAIFANSCFGRSRSAASNGVAGASTDSMTAVCSGAGASADSMPTVCSGAASEEAVDDLAADTGGFLTRIDALSLPPVIETCILGACVLYVSFRELLWSR